MSNQQINQPLLFLAMLFAAVTFLLSCNKTKSQIQIAPPPQPLPSISTIPETPEAKAIRLAEEFIARNGYTDLPPDKNAISHETVEFAESLEKLLQFRHDTLEGKAYGVCYHGRLGTKGGWTVVFRQKNVSDTYYQIISQQAGRKITKENFPLGRSVTMNANYENLLVEHKDFPLENVDKKLQ